MVESSGLDFKDLVLPESPPATRRTSISSVPRSAGRRRAWPDAVRLSDLAPSPRLPRSHPPASLFVDEETESE